MDRDAAQPQTPSSTAYEAHPSQAPLPGTLPPSDSPGQGTPSEASEPDATMKVPPPLVAIPDRDAVITHPTFVAGYEILGVLGRGSMGIV